MQDNASVNPCWDDDILALFTAPYWIDPAVRQQIAQKWLGCMNGYAIQLNDYDSVQTWSVLIYQWLYNRQMPLTDDSAEYWPDEALETFRSWVNEGWRKTANDPFSPAERIPKPKHRPLPLRIRKNILSLSQAELDDYRMRFDDAFQVANAAADAPGQVFFTIHGDWCLHYQEAFLLWHRAYLLAFEQRIGCAVPYWNWYAQDAAIEGTAEAGLPRAFCDLTYVHPRTGETRPNPLRFAAARNGRSKACSPTPAPSVDCFWVQRDPVLYTEGDDQREARRRKIALTLQYQQQVQRALAFKDFSHPQGIGHPWANITSFDPPPPDSEYVYRDYNFDGAYEQPHDNYHGWVGPDMADNAYTAFDPVFWSYHANIDRIFEIWLRANSSTATVTANFPLHPFKGPRADQLDLVDRRRFVFTTIGDMMRDSRAIGYDFAAPLTPDFGSPEAASSGQSCPMAGSTPSLVSAPPERNELLIIFDGVRCTFDSYAIDAFINQPGATLQDVDAANPHYAGRIARIGMGLQDTNNRCITHGVRRMLDATAAARKLGLSPGSANELSLLVTELSTGQPVTVDVYGSLPGFAGRLVWAQTGWAPASGVAAPPASKCH
jgi:hypothetical protein